MNGGDPASIEAPPVPDEPPPEAGAEPEAPAFPVLPGEPLAAPTDPDGALPELAVLPAVPALCMLPAPPRFGMLPEVAAVAPLTDLPAALPAPVALELAEQAVRATQPQSERQRSVLAIVEGTAEYS
jgi:hypothetical protein